MAHMQCTLGDPSVKKSYKKKRAAQCILQERVPPDTGWVLQRDSLAAGQSVSTPLVVPWLLQHARSSEEQGNDSFTEVGHFVPYQTPCAGAKSSNKIWAIAIFAMANSRVCLSGYVQEVRT